VPLSPSIFKNEFFSLKADKLFSASPFLIPIADSARNYLVPPSPSPAVVKENPTAELLKKSSGSTKSPFGHEKGPGKFNVLGTSSAKSPSVLSDLLIVLLW
jgi:hypothetical protein